MTDAKTRLDERRFADAEQQPITEDPRVRWRSEGERDRDRILYCSAFHRLAGITQVVPVGSGQAVHSRLTHTLQVAQVARRLAQRVRSRHPEFADELDPDRVEASALAHDLGHPPFGHVAEIELDKLARHHGCEGFEGNAQSFRIVTRLAQRWPWTEDIGLNLTRGTLDGLLKYPWTRGSSDSGHKHRKWGAYREDSKAFDWVRSGRPDGDDTRALAAAIMDWADDVTYAVHDMEDFYRAGLIPLDRLCTSKAERERFANSFVKPGTDEPIDRLRAFDPAELRRAVAWLFADYLDFVEPYDGSRQLRLALRQRTSTLVSAYMHAFEVGLDGAQLEPQARTEVTVLQQLTWFYVIDRQELATVQEGQRQIIRNLFSLYHQSAVEGRLELFPPLERDLLCRIEANDAVEHRGALTRIVVDYVARLIEARALELHRRQRGVTIPTLPPPIH